MEPPAVPEERFAAGGWRETDRSVEQPFETPMVSVEAHTTVYEDAALRDRLREATGVDHEWRFFLASRLRLSPRTPTSRALTRLVTDRARAGFRERLTDRGFRQLRRTADERRDRNGTTARVATYESLTQTAPATLRTRARLAVWPGDREYLLAGGGWPSGVRAADENARAVLERAVDPEAFERELDELVAATG